MMRVALLALLVGCGSSSSPDPAKEKPAARSATLPAQAAPAPKPAPIEPAAVTQERGPVVVAPQQVPAMKKRLAELDRMIEQAQSDAKDAGSASGREAAAAELAALQQQRTELASAIDDAASGKPRVLATP